MGSGSSKTVQVGSTVCTVVEKLGKQKNDIDGEDELFKVCESTTGMIYLLRRIIIPKHKTASFAYLSGVDCLSRVPSHPNVVKYHHSSHSIRSDGSVEFALLTEYCSNGRLGNAIDSTLIATDVKIKIFEDICRAVAHLHSHQIAHLNIKPTTIYQNGFGVWKLGGDWQNAVRLDGPTHRIQLFDSGTRDAFDAPELSDAHQLSNIFAQRSTFKWCDVWSLGCLLCYLMLDQRLPEIKTKANGIAEAIVPNGPTAIIHIIRRCLHPNPQRRINTEQLTLFVDQIASDPLSLLLEEKADTDALPTHSNSAVARDANRSTLLSATSVSTSGGIRISGSVGSLGSIDDDPKQTVLRQRSRDHKGSIKKGDVLLSTMDRLFSRVTNPKNHHWRLFHNRYFYSLILLFWNHPSNEMVVERLYTLSAHYACNSITSISVITLLHKTMLETHPIFMKVSKAHISGMYGSIVERWSHDQSRDSFKALVVPYSQYMIERIQFHSQFIDFYENNLSLSAYFYHCFKNRSIGDHRAFFQTLQTSFPQLIKLGSTLCTLLNDFVALPIARTIVKFNGFRNTAATNVDRKDTNSGDASAEGALLSLVEVATQDLYYIYCLLSWALGFHRTILGKKATTQFSDPYKEWIGIVIATISKLRSFSPSLWEQVSAQLSAEFPTQIPKVSALSLQSVYPPPSFAPNLSSFTKDLTDRFSNMIRMAFSADQNKKKKKRGKKVSTAAAVATSPTTTSLATTTTTTTINDKTKVSKKPKSTSARRNTAAKPTFDRSQTQTTLRSLEKPNAAKPKRKRAQRNTHMRTKSHTTFNLEIVKDNREMRATTPEPQMKPMTSFPFPDDEDESEHSSIDDERPASENPIKPVTSADDITAMSPMYALFESHTMSYATSDNDNDAMADDNLTKRDGFQRYLSSDEENDENKDMCSSDDEYKHNGGGGGRDIDDAAMGDMPVKPGDEIEWEQLTLGPRIGIGGFAEVFKATFKKQSASDEAISDEKVAVKQLIHQNLTRSNLKEFALEVKIMRRISHPNIVRFVGAICRPPHLCIVTELLEMSLFDLLHNTRLKLSPKIKVKIALGSARGLAFLHETNTIHRDLKSANILLDSHFEPRISDFGLSRIKDEYGDYMTAQTGTFQWMSPEVIMGHKYTEKVDIYSLAVIIWEIVSGRLPFAGLNGVQASVAVVTQRKRPTMSADIPFEWQKLIVACWQHIPNKRPTAKQVVVGLQTIETTVSHT